MTRCVNEIVVLGSPEPRNDFEAQRFHVFSHTAIFMFGFRGLSRFLTTSRLEFGDASNRGGLVRGVTPPQWHCQWQQLCQQLEEQ